MHATIHWHFQWGSIPVHLIESIDFSTNQSKPQAILIGKNRGIHKDDWRYSEIYAHLLDNRESILKLPCS